MSRAIQCDGCGEYVREETVAFEIEYMARQVGGDIVDPEGNTHDFDHRGAYGDLCSECSTDVIAAINQVLSDE